MIFSGTLNVLPGDFNDDGIVNNEDVADIKDQWLSLNGARPTVYGDLNGDGVVNSADYYAALSSLGTSLAGPNCSRRPHFVSQPRNCLQ